MGYEYFLVRYCILHLYSLIAITPTLSEFVTDRPRRCEAKRGIRGILDHGSFRYGERGDLPEHCRKILECFISQIKGRKVSFFWRI